MNIKTAIQLSAAALLLLPSFAHAHGGVGDSFMHGLAHPTGGLDHVCAMLAVGLWAAQTGGRAVWAVPLAFVGAMALGGAMGALGIGLPFAEQGIALSVLLLGVLIAAAVRLPLWLGSMTAGLFALWHGHAHGAGMPALADGTGYALGFLLATALLHVVGVMFGLGMQRRACERFIQTAGAGIALCGVYLSAG